MLPKISREAVELPRLSPCVEELETRLHKHSTNSNKPPSSEAPLPEKERRNTCESRSTSALQGLFFYLFPGMTPCGSFLSRRVCGVGDFT